MLARSYDPAPGLGAGAGSGISRSNVRNSYYREIFTSEVWRSSFMNSLIYVLINVVMTLTAAIPAAYAFSRWKFRGDHHLFFWL